MNAKNVLYHVQRIIYALLTTLNRFLPDFIDDFLKKSNVKLSLAKMRAKTVATLSGGSISLGYDVWIEKNEPDISQLEIQKTAKFDYEPKISIVVSVINTPKKFLTDMLESVIGQTYTKWELCIADGASKKVHIKHVLETFSKNEPRIKVKFLSETKGISDNLNEALLLASGDFVAFLGQSDTLLPFTLFEIVKTLNATRNADFLYSDEDKISEDGTCRFEPHFKPDWSPDTLRSYNYISHLTVIRSDLLEKTGWLRHGYDGSQDYDIILRTTELATKIIHIPKVLYHWRVAVSATTDNMTANLSTNKAAKKALEDHLSRIGLKGDVVEGREPGICRINYAIPGKPMVSIIILNKDNAVLLEKCINSILEKSAYTHYEIIIVENNSTQEKTFKLYDDLKTKGNVKVVVWEKPFNYAAANNYAVGYARGEILLFLNNDTEVINADWLECMVGLAVRKDVGVVGAKLYYSDKTIQHAGIIVGIKNVAGHAHKYFSKKSSGYAGRLQTVQNVSAVTGACLVIRREVFEEVKGFDEDFILGLNDVDMCLKIREMGYLAVWTPYSELYHYEYKTRGHNDTPAKKELYEKEVRLFQKKWKYFLEGGDPYYSPNLTRNKEDFSINM